jgi:hypothetical protein
MITRADMITWGFTEDSYKPSAQEATYLIGGRLQLRLKPSTAKFNIKGCGCSFLNAQDYTAEQFKALLEGFQLEAEAEQVTI